MKPGLDLRSDYAAAVVARLRELKALGLRFDLAWSYAIADNPPSTFWLPRTRSPSGPAQRTLWDPVTEDEQEEETPLEFLRRICERAWRGEGELRLDWLSERAGR